MKGRVEGYPRNDKIEAAVQLCQPAMRRRVSNRKKIGNVAFSVTGQSDRVLVIRVGDSGLPKHKSQSSASHTSFRCQRRELLRKKHAFSIKDLRALSLRQHG